ncbi:MAG TPA: SDR family NAD(P)-dependent oxidoreductase [Devosia sp.]|nr:SDR family NAD(P)-dependent oxidoreductase [Devosia sp.]
MTDLGGKIVLVTGASRGIGYQAALEASRRGAHVIAVARTVGGLEDLDDEIKAGGGEATLVPLDLRDGDGIDRLGKAVFDRWGHLDGLIANAGVLGTITPVSHLDVKDFDQAFAVNVTANYRLIRSLDPLLRQAPAGRAVFVSSSSSQSARPFWGVYAATKAALEALVKSYAAELNTTPITANVFWPGAVRTAMRAKAMPGENPDTLPHPREVAGKLVDMVSPAWSGTRLVYDYSTGETRPL